MVKQLLAHSNSNVVFTRRSGGHRMEAGRGEGGLNCFSPIDGFLLLLFFLNLFWGHSTWGLHISSRSLWQECLHTWI